MRTYAGDTSLPGGKWEEGDRTIEWTAVRFITIAAIYAYAIL